MTNKTCLNCEKELTGNYCSDCGQKADTHRITFKNFIFHDLLHGTFHIDRGMVFTAKQALVRPGKAALDYISGKRKAYYNVFYLILITIGLIIFFRHLYDFLAGSEETVVQNQDKLNEASKAMAEIFSKKSKIIIFLFVPLSALNGFILFKKKKLNLSEHCIIAGMILLGMLLMSALGNLFFYLDLIVPFNDTFSFIMSWLVSIFIIFHSAYGYFNAFGTDYSKFGIAYRLVLVYVLMFLEIIILFLIVLGFVTNWKFGQVTISPFD